MAMMGARGLDLLCKTTKDKKQRCGGGGVGEGWSRGGLKKYCEPIRSSQVGSVYSRKTQGAPRKGFLLGLPSGWASNNSSDYCKLSCQV